MSESMTILVWLAKATALLVLAIGITAGLRRAPAGARYVVWLATLVAVLLVPAISSWSPLPLPILPSVAPATALPTQQPVAAIERSIVPRSSPTAPLPTVGASASRSAELSLSTILLLAWASVGALLLGWLTLGAITVGRIVRNARSLVDQTWLGPMYDVADRLDLEHAPRLVMSDAIEMPFACGILRPTVVLPSSAEQWSDERRRCVLFHELAHVRRRDLLGHTVGRIVCAFYWFHPLVWSAAKRLRAESERACDDLVLACGGARASSYANHLLEIVTSVRREGAPATALPMADKREFEGRMLAILDPAVKRSTPSRVQSLVLTFGLAGLSLTIAAAAPSRRPAAAANSVAATNPVAVNPAPLASPDVALTPAGLGRVQQSPRTNGTDSVTTWSTTGATATSTTTSRTTASSTTTTRTSATSAAAAEVATAATAFAGTVLAELSRRMQIAVSQGRQGPQGPQRPQRANVDTALLGKILRTDKDAGVRRAAAWVLQGHREGTALLIERLKTDQDEDVREMSAWALVSMGSADIAPVLVEALKSDKSENVRATAAWGLGHMHDRFDPAVLVAALSDPSADVRQRVLWALGQQELSVAPAKVVALLSDDRADVRLMAAWVLGEILDKATLPALREAFLKERDSETLQAEFRALLFMGDRSQAVIDRAMNHEDSDLRARAVRMIAGQGPGVWPWPWPWPDPRPEP